MVVFLNDDGENAQKNEGKFTFLDGDWGSIEEENEWFV